MSPENTAQPCELERRTVHTQPLPRRWGSGPVVSFLFSPRSAGRPTLSSPFQLQPPSRSLTDRVLRRRMATPAQPPRRQSTRVRSVDPNTNGDWEVFQPICAPRTRVIDGVATLRPRSSPTLPLPSPFSVQQSIAQHPPPRRAPPRYRRKPKKMDVQATPDDFLTEFSEGVTQSRHSTTATKVDGSEQLRMNNSPDVLQSSQVGLWPSLPAELPTATPTSPLDSHTSTTTEAETGDEVERTGELSSRSGDLIPASSCCTPLPATQLARGRSESGVRPDNAPVPGQCTAPSMPELADEWETKRIACPATGISFGTTTSGGWPPEHPGAALVSSSRTVNSTTSLSLTNTFNSATGWGSPYAALESITRENLEDVELGESLGRGTFGVVVKGTVETSHGNLVQLAVKMFSLAADRLQDAEREIEAMRRAAGHPNVIYYVGSVFVEESMQMRLFLEFVEGGSLKTNIEKHEPTLLTIQNFMRQILTGLAHLHSIGIVHRDLKAENILLTKDSVVKLTDFGCCGFLDQESTDGHSGLTCTAGTPASTSPELGEGQKASPASDIWSLGCLGIEMLRRKLWGFDAEGIPGLYKVMKARCPPHGLPKSEMIDELTTLHANEKMMVHCYANLLRRCLQVNPSERPSAAQLLEDEFFSLNVTRCRVVFTDELQLVRDVKRRPGRR